MSGFLSGSASKIDYLRGVTAATTWIRPAGATLKRVYIKNNTANAVTGGIKIGTTLAGVDIVAAAAVGASVQVDAVPLLSLMSAASSTVYVDAVTAFNSANLDIAFEYVLPF